MGGGALLGSSLKLDPKAGRPVISAVLLAAAEDAGWLSPGAEWDGDSHGRSHVAVEQRLR